MITEGPEEILKHALQRHVRPRELRHRRVDVRLRGAGHVGVATLSAVCPWRLAALINSRKVDAQKVAARSDHVADAGLKLKHPRVALRLRHDTVEDVVPVDAARRALVREEWPPRDQPRPYLPRSESRTVWIVLDGIQDGRVAREEAHDVRMAPCVDQLQIHASRKAVRSERRCIVEHDLHESQHGKLHAVCV